MLSVLPESDPTPAPCAHRIALDRGDDHAFEAILARGPTDHPELARLRGRFALAHGDGPTAARQFRIAYAADPDDRDIVFGLAPRLPSSATTPPPHPFFASRKPMTVSGVP